MTQNQADTDEPILINEPTNREIDNKDPLPSFIDLMTNSDKSKFDEKYVNSMITHLAVGSAMAKLVTDSKDEEVRTLAKYIINKNSSTNVQLRSWANDWNLRIEEPNNEAINEIISNINRYDGEERDHQFTLDILDHFDGSIGMAKLATANANKLELKNYANNVIEDELEQASNFYQWSRTVSFDNDDRFVAMHGTHDSY